jgi:hypothetical protein
LLHQLDKLTGGFGIAPRGLAADGFQGITQVPTQLDAACNLSGGVAHAGGVRCYGVGVVVGIAGRHAA